MYIKLNKTIFYVNFIKHKKRIYNYTHYTHIPLYPYGIHLHLKQNNITYNSTVKKNITEIIFTITQTQIENKTIYHSINTKNNY